MFALGLYDLFETVETSKRFREILEPRSLFTLKGCSSESKRLDPGSSWEALKGPFPF